MAEHGEVVFSFAAPGTISADWVIDVALKHAFMPRHVSFVGSSDENTCTLNLGTKAAPTAVIDAMAAGDSGTPAVYEPSDFEDADYQYAKGAIMEITISASGQDIDDPAVVITGLFGA